MCVGLGVQGVWCLTEMLKATAFALRPHQWPMDTHLGRWVGIMFGGDGGMGWGVTPRQPLSCSEESCGPGRKGLQALLPVTDSGCSPLSPLLLHSQALYLLRTPKARGRHPGALSNEKGAQGLPLL